MKPIKNLRGLKIGDLIYFEFKPNKDSNKFVDIVLEVEPYVKTRQYCLVGGYAQGCIKRYRNCNYNHDYSAFLIDDPDEKEKWLDKICVACL